MLRRVDLTCVVFLTAGTQVVIAIAGVPIVRGLYELGSNHDYTTHHRTLQTQEPRAGQRKRSTFHEGFVHHSAQRDGGGTTTTETI